MFRRKTGRNASQAAGELTEFKSNQDHIGSDHINEIDTPNDFELVSKTGNRPPRAVRHYHHAQNR